MVQARATVKLLAPNPGDDPNSPWVYVEFNRACVHQGLIEPLLAPSRGGDGAGRGGARRGGCTAVSSMSNMGLGTQAVYTVTVRVPSVRARRGGPGPTKA